MMPIKKLNATITSVVDLSPTSREVTLTLSEPMPFIAGSFVNLFLKHEDKMIRRAFSISSSEEVTDVIKLTIRLIPQGAITPLFWKDDIVATKVELMGPLGLNTADKMKSENIFLFGFGVGAGVMRSLAEHFVRAGNLKSLTIVTGSRTETEILHKDFFDILAKENKNVAVEYIISKPSVDSLHKSGYIQQHLSDLDFNNAHVYVCGQETSCDELMRTIKSQNPKNCEFMIEGFH